MTPDDYRDPPPEAPRCPRCRSNANVTEFHEGDWRYWCEADRMPFVGTVGEYERHQIAVAAEYAAQHDAETQHAAAVARGVIDRG